MTTYSSYAESVAKETRRFWSSEYAKHTIAKREYKHTDGRVYQLQALKEWIGKGTNNMVPYTITCGTTRYICNCNTIEEARKEWAKQEQWLLSNGYTKS